MKIRLLIALFILGIHLSNAQYSINDYKYVILEKQFHFQTEPNQYDLNRMAKFQFEKLGFTVVAEGQKLPDDLKSNYCLALTSEVSAKGLLRTKAQITLKNCHGETVYVSGEGVTKEKDLRRAFDVAIRKAFETMRGLNYRYVPNEAITSVGGSAEEVKKAEEKIEQLEAEIKELREEKEEIVEPTAEVKTIEVEENSIEEKQTVVEEVESTKETVNEENAFANYLKAVTAKNGFVVKDPEGKSVLFNLLRTSVKDVYLTSNNTGIVYLNSTGSWVREFVSDDKIETEVLKIKFQ